MQLEIIDPLVKLRAWIGEEVGSGTNFAHGAVLSTVSKLGQSRSRMLGVSFDRQNVPKFHTTPPSRKMDDIENNTSASLTFGWHGSLRSVSLEGQLIALDEEELVEDWSGLDVEFRRSYHIFGHQSGTALDEQKSLERERCKLPPTIETTRPISFIGFKFMRISRVAFYAVGDDNFATSEVFERSSQNEKWRGGQLVP